jgi:uncharacterized protein (TIGR00369 family)
MEWQDMAGSSPFASLIGPLRRRLADGQWIYGLRVLPEHANGNGVMHGGLLTAFVDEVVGNVVHDADEMRHVTVQLDVHFLQPVQIGELVECTTETVHRTRKMSFVTARCCVGARIVASASAIYKAIRPRTDADQHT